MNPYLNLLSDVISIGANTNNRTGINTRRIFGAMLRYDLADGFPIVTARKINYKSALAELCGFLRGFTNAADFRALGTKVWDANANQNTHWLNNEHLS